MKPPRVEVLTPAWAVVAMAILTVGAPASAGELLFVTVQFGDTVSVIDTATNTVLSEIPAGGVEPTSLATTADGAKVFVTAYQSKSVSVINVGSLSVEDTIPIGERPHGIAMTPDGSRAYVIGTDTGGAPGTGTNHLYAIDTVTHVVTGPFPSGGDPSPPITPDSIFLAMAPDGKAWITNRFSHTVSVFDTETNLLDSAPIPVEEAPGSPGDPASVVVSQDGSRIYVGNDRGSTAGSGYLWIIDASTRDVQTTTVSDLGTERLYGLSLTPDQSRVYATLSRTVYRLGFFDAQSGVLSGLTDPVTSLTCSNSEGGCLRGLAISSDGTKGYATIGSGATYGAVAVVDLASGALLDTIDAGIGAGPHQLLLLRTSGTCGDGMVNVGEECDDNNTTPGDGCDELCRVEKFFCCNNSNLSCNSDSPCSELDDTCCTAPDRYKCYRTQDTKRRCFGDLSRPCQVDADCFAQSLAPPCVGLPRGVTAGIVDEWESKTVDVKRTVGLCPPAETNGEPVRDEDIHMKRYKVKPVRGSPKHVKRTFVADDQYGRHVLQSRKVDSLLVPSLKQEPPGTAGDPGLPTTGHDHYLCYRVREMRRVCTGDLATRCRRDADCVGPGGVCHLGKIPPKGTWVDLDDQLEDRPMEIRRLLYFCNPVDENGEGIANGVCHLVGYKIKARKGVPKHVQVPNIHVRNHFGIEVLKTRKEDLVFVPATKNGVGGCSTAITNGPTSMIDAGQVSEL
jgi:cysteine-rich repeat protein/YVTN family beta-propeller protein